MRLKRKWYRKFLKTDLEEFIKLPRQGFYYIDAFFNKIISYTLGKISLF